MRDERTRARFADAAASSGDIGRDRIFIELTTSERKLKASREGAK